MDKWDRYVVVWGDLQSGQVYAIGRTRVGGNYYIVRSQGGSESTVAVFTSEAEALRFWDIFFKHR